MNMAWMKRVLPICSYHISETEKKEMSGDNNMQKNIVEEVEETNIIYNAHDTKKKMQYLGKCNGPVRDRYKRHEGTRSVELVPPKS